MLAKTRKGKRRHRPVIACSPPALRPENGARFAAGNTDDAATQCQPVQSSNPGGHPKSLAVNIRAKRSRSCAIVDEGTAPQEVTITKTEDNQSYQLRFADDELPQMREIHKRIAQGAREAANTSASDEPASGPLK